MQILLRLFFFFGFWFIYGPHSRTIRDDAFSERRLGGAGALRTI